MYKISKQFELCYTHRVHTQELSPGLSNNSSCKCKHCHGHNSVITVELQGENLNSQGMLVDYVNLNFLKKFIDEELDHKTLLDINDPWTIDFINSTRPPESRIERVDSVLVPRLAPNQNSYSDPKFYNTTTPSKIPHHIDVNKGLVLLPFVPTSENICKWLHGIVSLSLSDFCDQISVSFSETPKTLATYTE